jgi:hypothetical protein
VAVNTEIASDSPIVRTLGRHSPQLVEASARMFSFHDEAGFECGDCLGNHSRHVSDLCRLLWPWESGGGSVGQAFVALPEAERTAIREEVRLALATKGDLSSLTRRRGSRGVFAMGGLPIADELVCRTSPSYFCPLTKRISASTVIGLPSSRSNPRRTSSLTASRTSSGSALYSAPVAPSPRPAS